MTKGQITLIITALITIVSFFLEGDIGSVVFTMGTTGLIGCGTNALAIRMLFDRIFLHPTKEKWALPCSGILEQRRVEVAAGIGWVVSRRLLAPDTLLRNFRAPEFQAKANDIVNESLASLAQDDQLLENMVCDMEKALFAFTDSDIFRQKLQHALYRADSLEKMLGNGEKQRQEKLLNKVMHKLRDKVSDFRAWERVTPQLQKEMKRVLGYICADPIFHESVRLFVQESLQKLIETQTPLKGDLQKHGADLLREFIEKMEIEEMVTNEVCSFPPGVLRDLMYRITAENLDWLEVWGGALGALGGLCFWLLARAI